MGELTPEQRQEKMKFLVAFIKKMMEAKAQSGDDVPKIQGGGIYRGGIPYFSKCAALDILRSKRDMDRLWRYRRGWAAAAK
jgi:hypothetical protein